MKTQILTALLPLIAGAAPPDIAGTLKVDPVELLRGNEIPGKERLSTTHYRFRYLFANEENRAEFLDHPDIYEIQLGGACARMGPLSGIGKTDIYTTYNNKIYIFASEACKQTFLQDPRKVLDRPDAVPVARGDSQQQARELIRKITRAMGGAERIDSISVYQRKTRKQSEWEGKTFDAVDTVTLAFPSRIRLDHVWGDDRYTTVVTETDAWKKHPDKQFTLHPQQRQAAETRYLGRNLLAILKARNEPDFIAVHTGRHKIDYKGDATEVELINVHHRGATNVLGIDPDTGRVLMQAYFGRGPDLTLGMVEKICTDFQTLNGLVLPEEPRLRFNGEEVDPASDDEVTTALDISLPPAFFDRPPGE